MKKTIKILCVLTALAVVIVSCKKDEMVNTVTPNGSATISGIVYANLDTRNDTNDLGAVEVQDEISTEEISLYATINTQDLVQFNTGNANDYADKVYSTTVADDGTYSFELPANDEQVTVTIWSDNYAYTVPDSDTTDHDAVFGLAAPFPTITIWEDATRILNITLTEQ